VITLGVMAQSEAVPVSSLGLSEFCQTNEETFLSNGKTPSNLGWEKPFLDEMPVQNT
jgi:hypothetical protein